MTKRLTVTDEVSAGAWSEASMLIRHVLEHPYDLSGFHKLEDQVQTSWMPQALACIAAHLVQQLAGTAAKLPGPRGVHLADDIPGDVLTKAVHDIMTIQDRRNQT